MSSPFEVSLDQRISGPRYRAGLEKPSPLNSLLPRGFNILSELHASRLGYKKPPAHPGPNILSAAFRFVFTGKADEFGLIIHEYFPVGITGIDKKVSESLGELVNVALRFNEKISDEEYRGYSLNLWLDQEARAYSNITDFDEVKPEQAVGYLLGKRQAEREEKLLAALFGEEREAHLRVERLNGAAGYVSIAAMLRKK